MSKLIDVTEGIYSILTVLTISDYAWPNRPFDAKSVDEYIAIDFLPVESETESLGDDRSAGIIQITPYIRDGKGINPLFRMADTIVDTFPKGRSITQGVTTFRITQTPWPAPPLVGGGWAYAPVTIPYQVYG